MRASSGKARDRSRSSPASARCAARTMRRTRPARLAAVLALGLDAGDDPGGPALVPRPRAPHGAGRPQGRGAVRQRFQGDQRRFHGAGAGVASPTFSGSPAASRRPAASTPLAEFFPRIRKAYLIGEAARRLRHGRSTARSPTRSPARSTAPSRPPPATPRRRAQGAGGAAVAGLRLVRPVSGISRCAATASASWCWRCRGVKPVK